VRQHERSVLVNASARGNRGASVVLTIQIRANDILTSRAEATAHNEHVTTLAEWYGLTGSKPGCRRMIGRRGRRADCGSNGSDNRSA